MSTPSGWQRTKHAVPPPARGHRRLRRGRAGAVYERPVSYTFLGRTRAVTLAVVPAGTAGRSSGRSTDAGARDPLVGLLVAVLPSTATPQSTRSRRTRRHRWPACPTDVFHGQVVTLADGDRYEVTFAKQGQSIRGRRWDAATQTWGPRRVIFKDPDLRCWGLHAAGAGNGVAVRIGCGRPSSRTGTATPTRSSPPTPRPGSRADCPATAGGVPASRRPAPRPSGHAATTTTRGAPRPASSDARRLLRVGCSRVRRR